MHPSPIKKKFVIIGGGVAGLCAAIRLAELGEKSLLLEGGSYPAHKICGEFLSPECLPYLNDWNIHPVPISQLVLRTATQRLVFPFPSPAGGLSHILLDPALADYASALGVAIRTNTLVRSIEQKKRATESHLLQLSDDEAIEAENIILAAGRYSNTAASLAYMGFKAHFEDLPLEAGHLEMFSLPGAYLGISPIENRQFNVACLTDLKKIKGMNPNLFMEQLTAQHPRLRDMLSQGKNVFGHWMAASLPDFGIKKTPDWHDAYFIGDAALAIPPACGNGLSLAIFGGRLAAEYAVQQKAREFNLMWKKRCTSQLFWAKALHRLMLHPSGGHLLLPLGRYFPSIAQKMFEWTRQRIIH